MGTAPDKTNRTLVALLGLLLLAAGVVTFLVSFGVFGSSLADKPVLSEDVTSFVDRNSQWFWLVVGVVAAVIALLALRWLLAQVSSDRVSHLELERDPSRGSTTLQTSAVTSALTEEIESYRGVSSASARFLHSKVDPDLVVTVKLTERADIGATRERIEREAIAHARQAMDMPALSTELLLKPAAAGPR